MSEESPASLPQMGKFSLAIHKALDWCLGNTKILTISVFGFLFVSFLTFQIVIKHNLTKIENYILASKLDFELESDLSGLDKTLPSLLNLIKHYPELGERFDTAIVKYQMDNKEILKAKTNAQKIFLRLPEKGSYYSSFSQITFLIQEGKIQEALQNSISLKNAIDSDKSFWENQKKSAPFGRDLYIFNLFRIALLQGESGFGREEFLAWSDLEKFLTKKEGYIPSQLEKAFDRNGVSFLEYIKFREGVLNNFSLKP